MAASAGPPTLSSDAWVEIFKAGIASPLGFVGLLAVLLGFVAVYLFWKSSDLTKLCAFALLFVGACAASASVYNKGADAVQKVQNLQKTLPSNGQVFPDSATRALAASDLSSLSGDKLCLARNEIYARHGRIFQTNSLKNYFSKFDWYKPVSTDVMLSPLEQQNVNLIAQTEKAHNTSCADLIV